jgi:redox-sensitive bicupin YhaK (pirin superfamily)
MSIAAMFAPDPVRRIAHRSRGHTHGCISRLMSPGDLGQVLKPFVVLDLFDHQGGVFPAFGLHPHSGLATLTYVAEGSVSYEDTNGASIPRRRLGGCLSFRRPSTAMTPPSQSPSDR